MGRTSSATTCPVIPFPRPGGPPRSDLPCAGPPGVSPRHRRRRMPRARRRPRAMHPPARCIAPFCLFCEARVPSPCVFLVMPCLFDYLPLCVPSFAARCEIGHFACSRSFSASWSRTCHVTFFTTAQAPKRSRQKEKKRNRGCVCFHVYIHTHSAPFGMTFTRLSWAWPHPPSPRRIPTFPVGTGQTSDCPGRWGHVLLRPLLPLASHTHTLACGATLARSGALYVSAGSEEAPGCITVSSSTTTLGAVFCTARVAEDWYCA